MKSKGIAYLLWFVGIFGILGLHRFYLGKIGTGVLWFFTGGLFGIGSLIDLFTLGSKVDNYNTKEELKTIRANALLNGTPPPSSPQNRPPVQRESFSRDDSSHYV